MAKYSGREDNLQAVADLVNKSEGRPQKGVRVGGGIHVEIAAEYSPGAVGWLGEVAPKAGALEIGAGALEALATSEKLDPLERAAAVELALEVVADDKLTSTPAKGALSRATPEGGQ